MKDFNERPLRRFAFFGPQGSGKGTQAQLFSNRLSIPHISPGELFRFHIKEKTDLGLDISQFVSEGKLVPDHIINQLMRERLREQDAHNGFVLDGYPRTCSQADELELMGGIDRMLEIWISDEESVRRTVDRLVCECGKIYHRVYVPPVRHETCDVCGSPLSQREDDTEEVVRRRLFVYHAETEPMFALYRAQQKYIQINGEQLIKDVEKEIYEKVFETILSVEYDQNKT